MRDLVADGVDPHRGKQVLAAQWRLLKCGLAFRHHLAAMSISAR